MLRLADLVIRWRWSIVGVTLLVTALLGWQARHVTLNGDFATYLDQDDPLVREYDEVGDIFGGNATGIVLVEAEGDVFTPENLTLVARLTDSLRQVAGVADVISLTNVVDFRQTGWGLEVRDLVDAGALPDGPREREELRRYVLGEERYAGTLASEDGTATAILVRFAGGGTEPVNQFVTAGRVKAAGDAVAAVRSPAGTSVYYGGMPFLVFNMTELITGNLRYLVPLMILVLTLILYLGFRHWAGVVFPLLVVGVSVVWIVGMMGLLGLQFDLLTGIVPVVLLALGSADAIHLIKRYFERRDDGNDAVEASRMVFREMGTPIALTTVTTMVGFASLAISDFDVIRQFGLLTAAGVFIALVVSLTLLPALLSFGVGVRPRRKTLFAPSRWLGGLSTWVYGHKPAVVGAGAMILGVSLVALPRIQKDVDWSLCLARGSDAHYAEMLLREKFDGSLPVQVRVRGDLKDPAVLAMMRRVERRLEAVPEVSQAQSMGYLLADMNRVMNDRFAVPRARQGTANLWLLVEDEEVVGQMVAGENRDGLVQARLATWHTASLVEAVDSVNTLLAGLPRRLAAVDLTQVSHEARAALLDVQHEQIVRELTWDFARFGVPIQRQVLEHAVSRGFTAGHMAVANQAVQDAARAYLTSPEAEVPLPENDARRLAAAVATGLPETDVETITARVREVAPGAGPDEAAWLAESLAAVAGQAQGEAQVEAALAALPPVAHEPGDLQKAVRGTLWSLAGDVVYLDAGQARRLAPADAIARELEWEAHQTGMPPVLKQMEEELTPTQVESLFLALGFVTLLLALIFRSALGAVLAVVPITLTILVNFAVMGYAGIGLDAFTAMIASIAIGLGIDTDIHFVTRLRDELRRGGGELEALKRTVRTTGLSIVINAVAVGSGFLVLLAAGGQHIRRFGGLTALTVFVSATLTLTVLAALLLWARPRFLRAAAAEGERAETDRARRAAVPA